MNRNQLVIETFEEFARENCIRYSIRDNSAKHTWTIMSKRLKIMESDLNQALGQKDHWFDMYKKDIKAHDKESDV